MGFLDAQSSLAQVGLRIALVGAGTGLFQAAAFTLMMSSVPADRFGTAGAALSLAQAMGTVLSVAVTGGLFALSIDYHLGVLGGNGLEAADGQARAFVLAYRDVFCLGAVITILGAGGAGFEPVNGSHERCAMVPPPGEQRGTAEGVECEPRPQGRWLN